MIKAYVFDLDDTLYPEYEYVKSGFKHVAKLLRERYAISDGYDKLLRLFAQDKQLVYDRLLESENAAYGPKDVANLVEEYRAHVPDKLELFDGVKNTLSQLRKSGFKLGIITDGRVNAQTAKINALGIAPFVDKIIITDSLGGEQYRKPNPEAFVQMAIGLGVDFEEMAYVGDNPAKDFAVKKYLPIHTVRVWHGCDIYKDKDYLDGIKPDEEIQTIDELLKGE